MWDRTEAYDAWGAIEVGDWDPTAVPPIDGELTSVDTSLAQSGLHSTAAAQGSSGAEHEPEPEASQVEDDSMDIDLEPIPEEEPEEAEAEVDPEVEPEVEPEDEPGEFEEPVGDPEYILPFE
ncbi:uncharacterized protein LOC115692407 [Syzygium oleosum]|uniref:uncharacterized protein LOC115692407 n=1 Tax=Syzygium oleosum TaxID=219896 RepID=UPI0024BA2379|nr:uncharacterized protein LOC115692407 [Syzygium oleosum]